MYNPEHTSYSCFVLIFKAQNAEEVQTFDEQFHSSYEKRADMFQHAVLLENKDNGRKDYCPLQISLK